MYECTGMCAHVYKYANGACLGEGMCGGVGMCAYRYVCMGIGVHVCTNVLYMRVYVHAHIYIHAFTDTPDASTLHTSEAQCAPPQEMLTHNNKFSHYLV